MNSLVLDELDDFYENDCPSSCGSVSDDDGGEAEAAPPSAAPAAAEVSERRARLIKFGLVAPGPGEEHLVSALAATTIACGPCGGKGKAEDEEDEEEEKEDEDESKISLEANDQAILEALLAAHQPVPVAARQPKPSSPLAVSAGAPAQFLADEDHVRIAKSVRAGKPFRLLDAEGEGVSGGLDSVSKQYRIAMHYAGTKAQVIGVDASFEAKPLRAGLHELKEAGMVQERMTARCCELHDELVANLAEIAK